MKKVIVTYVEREQYIYAIPNDVFNEEFDGLDDEKLAVALYNTDGYLEGTTNIDADAFESVNIQETA
jgi:hypothetical protein